jgi:HAMP domain-containing protein
MFNNLGSRALVPVALTLTGFVIVGCLLLYSMIRSDLEKETIRHETSLAATVIQTTRFAMCRTDQDFLTQMMQGIGERQGVEHLRIFDSYGQVAFSADPSEVKHPVDMVAAGCSGCHIDGVDASAHGDMEKARQFTNDRHRQVLAITTPIYGEPNCFVGDCHAQAVGKSSLGTLDIGFSADPLNQALTTLRWRMIVFCGMVLILAVGGTGALLYRNVLLPIRQLQDFADRLHHGERDVEQPSGIAEVEELAWRFRQMALKGEKGVVDSDSSSP